MRRGLGIPGALGVIALALVGLLLFGLLRSGATSRQESLDARVERGQAVPALATDRLLRGLTTEKPMSLQRLRGQIVVMNFWASWCRPCESEAPLLERTHRTLKRAGAGTVLGVTYNDVPRSSIAFAERFGLSYPLHVDPGTEFALQYGVRALPETIFIDQRGRIRSIARGELTEAFTISALRRAGFTGSIAR